MARKKPAATGRWRPSPWPAIAVFLFLIVPFAYGLKSYGFDPQALDSLGSVDALAMTGPEFLRFYGLLILLAGLGVLLLRGLLQTVSRRRPPATWQPQAPELAFVAGGARQSLIAALVALSEKKTVVELRGSGLALEAVALVGAAAVVAAAVVAGAEPAGEEGVTRAPRFRQGNEGSTPIRFTGL